mgnify:CR=1 FL=1
MWDSLLFILPKSCFATKSLPEAALTSPNNVFMNVDFPEPLLQTALYTPQYAGVPSGQTAEEHKFGFEGF